MRKVVYAAIAVAVVGAAAWDLFTIEPADAFVEQQSVIDIMALQAGSKNLPVAKINGLI